MENSQHEHRTPAVDPDPESLAHPGLRWLEPPVPEFPSSRNSSNEGFPNSLWPHSQTGIQKQGQGGM